MLSDEFMEELFCRYPGDETLFGKGETPSTPLKNLVPLCCGFSRVKGSVVYVQDATGNTWYLSPYASSTDPIRSDPRSIALFEEHRDKEDSISIWNVPDHCTWKIREYDGLESVEWELPVARMLEDLRALRTDSQRELHPLTEKWLESSVSFKEFEKAVGDTA